MSIQIAEVAIPISIALNEQFDYLVPPSLKPAIAVGCRVLVPFGTSIILGYVVKLKAHSAFENRLKPIIKNLDETPVLSTELLKLATRIHDNYLCSLANAISIMMPSATKNEDVYKQHIPTLDLTDDESKLSAEKELKKSIVLIHDLTNEKRWGAYSALIKKTLNAKKSVIFLVPDHQKIQPSLDLLKLGIEAFVISSRTKPQESLKTYRSIKEADFSFVIGTRSAIFAPVNTLGLVIIEEEEHFAYRQDQVPHYRACEVAFDRAINHEAQVVLGSFTPSLDSYALTKNKQAGYCIFKAAAIHAPVKIIDMRQEFGFKYKRKIISKVLEYRMADAFERKEKMLFFSNKKGFSTFLYCQKCEKVQVCPRCSSSLSYSLKDKMVSCPTCQYKTASFDICPQCKSSYVHYSGFGLEKVESEILRLFPSAKIYIFDKNKTEPASYDIMLATQQFMEVPDWSRHSFGMVCVLTCEQMLGHVDFRSSEKAFGKLTRLLSLAKKELCLQTHVVKNDALRFLSAEDPRNFFEHELAERKDLKLPPFVKMAILAIRSKDQKKALTAALDFYGQLKKSPKKKDLCKFFEPIASIPFKVRGNYRYQIFIKYKKIEPLAKMLRPLIKKRGRGVIATFDPSIA